MASIRSKKKGSRYRINNDIDAKQVRLVGSTGKECGIVSILEALQAARDARLDLVEIAPNASPPVVKIMDYGKHVFEQGKSKSGAKKKQSHQSIKEVKFRPRTDEGDYQVKLRNLRRFLERGDKAKIVICFRGYRELAVLRTLAGEMLERLQQDLEDYGKVDQFPKLEGRQFMMLMSPGKSKTEVKAK